MNVTKENFERTMTGVFYAFKASDYNSNCFSYNEVVFHDVCEENCLTVIKKIEEAGYNPYDLLIGILTSLNIDNLKDNFSKELKSKIDDEFSIQTDDYYVNWGLEIFRNHGGLV